MTTPEPYTLACMEIWGGNRPVAQELALPGLAGWIYSQPLGSAAGGDVYYISLCGHGALTRVSVADVSGHGEAVSRVGDCLRKLVRKNIDTFDQSEFARELNRSFEQECLSGKFATVVLLGYYRTSGDLLLTNAGHPPPFWYRAAQRQWDLLEENTPHAESVLADLPLGLIPGTDYHQIGVHLELGDLVLVYSDALSEAHNRMGEFPGPEGLLELAREVPVDSPVTAGQALLGAVERFRGGQPVNDDQTLVVLQRVAN